MRWTYIPVMLRRGVGVESGADRPGGIGSAEAAKTV